MSRAEAALVEAAPALSNSNHTVTYRGIPAYSDSDGTLKKFHCKRVASYCVTVSKHFYCMKVQLGVQKSVTLRGELFTASL